MQLAQVSRAPSLVLRGLAVGFVATQVLDIVSILLYENLSPQDRRHEDQVRKGKQAYEVAVDRVTSGKLNRKNVGFWGWKLHRALGFAGGLQYVLLSRFFPKMRSGLGLTFGIGFFAVADQFLIYLTRLTPGPQRFSWKTHARGAIAHIAYGVAAELATRSYERIDPYERPRFSTSKWMNQSALQ